MRNVIRSVALLALTACSEQPVGPDSPAFAALTSTVIEFIPVSITTFIPCAAGGAGEDVTVSGNLHVVTHLTVNAAGGFTFRSQFQPQGVVGWGSVTGDKYQGTGVTKETGTLNRGETYTLVNNFRMIGQRAGNNAQVHQSIHLTLNANGVLTATADNTSVTCK